jgi:transcriptional regulator with XRE-family HTH domain
MNKDLNDSNISELSKLKQVVSTDLERKLKEYSNRKVGIRLLAQKMDLNSRTLTRLLEKENRPTYQTLLKIYHHIYQTIEFSILEKSAPTIVIKEIIKHCPDIKNQVSYNLPKIDNELLYDRCFSEIYIHAGCGAISKEFIQFRFGVIGLETLEKMIELQAIILTRNGQYAIGPNQPRFSAEIIKRMGISITEKYSDTDKGEIAGSNFSGFYAEGLTEEAYDKWLAIDERAFKEKIQVTKENKNKGNFKVFTYMVTDTLIKK